jgi:hypothetical protein
MGFENLKIWRFENGAMRRVLRTGFLCLFVSIIHPQISTAQHYLGVKAGYGAAQGRIQTVWGAPQGKMEWNKYSAGLVWKYFSAQQVVGGLSAELEFQQRGYSVYDGGIPGAISPIISDTTSYRMKTRTVSSVTLPLIWQPHLYMFNRRVRFFLSAGITFTYNLGMGDNLTVTEYGFDGQGNRTIETVSAPYEMNTARDVRWNYGWLGGAGLSFFVDRWEIFAEGRYYYGMSDIMRNDTKYKFNDERTIRSELDNIYISVGVTFRLGKGGILAPPLRRPEAAPAGDNDFRNIKLNL